jgi:hypothetical protein
MRTSTKLLSALSFLAVSILSSGPAEAWAPNGTNTTISNVVAYQDDVADVIVQFTSGDTCHFNANAANGKNLLSVVLGFYLSGKQVRIYCYDATNTVMGWTSHRLHRISGI